MFEMIKQNSTNKQLKNNKVGQQKNNGNRCNPKQPHAAISATLVVSQPLIVSMDGTWNQLRTGTTWYSMLVPGTEDEVHFSFVAHLPVFSGSTCIWGAPAIL